MNKLLALLALASVSSAAACPRYATLFNGTVKATIHGVLPFCSDQGRFWQTRFTNLFREAGSTVHYVEVYKANMTASGGRAAWENTTANLAKLLNMIGYRFEDVEDLDGGGIIATFHKANTEKRHIALIIQPMDGFEMITIVNMDMPFGHRFDE